ncbi:MAG: TetR/AcrR family transcriptional regulator [Verrucomicrobia bacterium]|nr:TetR/AcrR family transcriptional regulator [Verrucomicrobiota bacterium]
MASTSSLDTRQRLVTSMRRLVQRRGYNGFGLTELLADAGAPKGVLYHHFPGGKVALAVEAVQRSAESTVASLRAVLAEKRTVKAALVAWLEGAAERLEKSGFANGCPLATITLETAATEPALREALDAAFSQLRAALAETLTSEGRSRAQAERLSALFISAYEGALLQARAARDTSIVVSTLRALEPLLTPDPA